MVPEACCEFDFHAEMAVQLVKVRCIVLTTLKWFFIL